MPDSSQQSLFDLLNKPACAECRGPLHARRGRRGLGPRFCDECSKLRNRRSKTASKALRAVAHSLERNRDLRFYFCDQCGNGCSQLKNKGRPRRFCEICAWGEDIRWTQSPDALRGQRIRANKAAAIKRAVEKAKRSALFCLQCKARLHGARRKFCSQKCNKDYIEAARHAARVAKHGGAWPKAVCVECDAEFVARPHGNRPRQFCKQSCGRRHFLRIRTRARRAASIGLVVFDLDPLEIFWRDNWTCQACGIDTPRHMKGLMEPNSPEMDHILPLTRGGPHSPENCRCLCRTCNLDKGNRTDKEWKAGKPHAKLLTDPLRRKRAA